MTETDKLSSATEIIETIPVGELNLVAMKGTENIASQINEYLVRWRTERESEHKENILFNNYEKDSYILDARCPRFGSGEAKGEINQSVRGHDLFILTDITNYSVTYKMCGMINHYSPDDHFQDLKRIIAAAAGKAKRITVIMPFLYEGRQHKRSGRESLDCALMLQELVNMGVNNIITFDAHDPRVQNAIPLNGFDTVSPTYQYIKALLKTYNDLDLDSHHMVVISPDEGGTSRAVYFANMLKLQIGMFYKRRDYTRVVDGKNPILSHVFMGASVKGKDVVIVDDMISSGDSMLDVASKLKAKGAKRVFCCATFGLFTNGLERFDKAQEAGIIDKVFTTNLVYQTPELLSRSWYKSVEMSKYVALLVDRLNHDVSISSLLDPADRINRRVSAYKQKREADLLAEKQNA